MDVFKPAMPILTRLIEAGHEAYIVGGSVRDYLLNQPINDIDIATSAKPEDVMALFEQVIPVGIEHGTVIVRDNHLSYEVTTFREETTYSDSRHPDAVVFVSDIKLDLARRDFTMNAVALSIDGKVIDPFNGQTDIKHKRIRAVGDPHARFKEDALRMLRAIRFTSQLGFEIENNTKQALVKNLSAINHISIERIQVELEKLFQGQFLKKAIMLKETAQLLQLLPLFKEYPNALNTLKQDTRPYQALVDVFVYMCFEHERLNCRDIARFYRLSKKQTNEIDALYEALSAYQSNKPLMLIVYHLDTSLFDRFIDLVKRLFNELLSTAEVNKTYEHLPILSKHDMALNGHDLMALFPDRPKGRWISEILHQLEKAIILDIVPNQQEELKEWVRWSYPIEKE